MYRRNKYRQRPVRVPTIVGTQNIFAAPRKLLSDIRHSFVLEANGQVVMPSTDSAELYDAHDTLMIFARVLPEFAALSGEHIYTKPIVLLANRLRHDMPIDDAALSPVEAIFERGHVLANRATPDQALAILRGPT